MGQGQLRVIIHIFVELEYILTLQEMCCGFLLSREMWYRKSVLPGTGAGWAELKIDYKMQKILLV